jgi:arsenate reductase
MTTNCCSSNDGGYAIAKSENFDSCLDGSSCIKIDRLYASSPSSIPLNTPESTTLDICRKLIAEMLGTAILIIVVMGSGIMAQSLSPNDTGLQLLENAIATCGGLIGLILMFGPVSGAHFNPIVSMVDYLHGDMQIRDFFLYTLCQIIGGIIGALITNVQFDLPQSISAKERNKPTLWLGEVTITLLLVIHGCVRTGQKHAVPFAVGTWVCGGYFFTSSTIFANPAVTIARMFSNSFAGIDPNSVGQFICFQVLGGFIGYLAILFFYPVNYSVKKDDNLYLRICIQGSDKV